jgi:hypothetical protein
VAVTAVAFFQIFYVLTCRTFVAPVRSIGWRFNPSISAGIAILLVLHAGFVHLPAAQALFDTAHLTPTQWALAAVAGALVVPAVTVEKRWRRSTAPRIGGPASHGQVRRMQHGWEVECAAMGCSSIIGCPAERLVTEAGPHAHTTAAANTGWRTFITKRLTDLSRRARNDISHDRVTAHAM